MAGMQADPGPLPHHLLPVQGLVLKRLDTSVSSLAWSQQQSCRRKLRLGCFPGAMEVSGVGSCIGWMLALFTGAFSVG